MKIILLFVSLFVINICLAQNFVILPLGIKGQVIKGNLFSDLDEQFKKGYKKSRISFDRRWRQYASVSIQTDTIKADLYVYPAKGLQIVVDRNGQISNIIFDLQKFKGYTADSLVLDNNLTLQNIITHLKTHDKDYVPAYILYHKEDHYVAQYKGLDFFFEYKMPEEDKARLKRMGNYAMQVTYYFEHLTDLSSIKMQRAQYTESYTSESDEDGGK